MIPFNVNQTYFVSRWWANSILRCVGQALVSTVQRSRGILITLLMLSTLLIASPASANNERSAILPSNCVDNSMGAFPWSKAGTSTAHDNWWEVLRDEEHWRLYNLKIDHNTGNIAGAYVKSTGACGTVSNDVSNWRFFGAFSGDRLQKEVDKTNERILDLDVSMMDGKPAYAALLMPNTGSEQKAWWWYAGVPFDTLDAKITENKARLVDISKYRVGKQWRYAGVMIANQGPDAKAWWYYDNVDPTFVEAELKKNNARLTNIEVDRNGKWTVIMEQSQGEPWWWYYGQSWNQVQKLAHQNNARIIDLAAMPGKDRWAVAMIGMK